MQLLRSIHSPALPRAGCALTIGNFDAIHLGHREILKTLGQRAAQRNLPAVVMTFDPHPQEYFRGADAVVRVTTASMRFFALQECGVDMMLSLRFNDELARTDAAQFIRVYLAERLRMKYLLIGDDFRFGAKRVGDLNMLSRHAAQYGYQVERADTLKRHDRRVSSTWVRELLGGGRLHQAEQLLGRKYTYVGRVMHGQRRGREWGFPTLNIAVRHRPALSGVFAVRVRGLERDAMPGVASLGTRPTLKSVASQPKNLLEVHLFDYHGEAYGRRVCVEFRQKIRDEEKFDDYATLTKRMAQDVQIAKQMLRASAA